MSRALSCVPPGEPSPRVCQTTRSPKAATAWRSPVSQPPLMNWHHPDPPAAPQRPEHQPEGRRGLALAGPVFTMSRPFSMVLAATSASCTALRFLHLLAMASASSVMGPLRVSR